MSSEFKIAYIINSMEGGGAALPVPSIVDVMRRAGAEVRVFALVRRDGRAIPALERAGIEVAVRDGGEKDHVAALLWLDRQISDWQPTHLWTSLSRATLLGQLVGLYRRIPVVSWQHAAFLKPANRRLLRATQRLSKLWIGDSEPVSRLTEERLNVPAERIATWPIFRADPDAPQAQTWQRGKPLRIGSLGRLHLVKGYDVLIEALATLAGTLPPIEVEIAGDGTERGALEELAAKRGVRNIKFVGYVEDNLRFLARLHLYVQPSRSEGLCVASHEAMQAGLPVVASAVGALPHSITSESGMVLAPGNPDALSKALATLLSNPQRLSEMGKAGRKRVLDIFGPERFEATGLAILDRTRKLTL